MLAIGSNANGAQMRHKAQREGFTLSVPLLRATIEGARVEPSSFLSSLGYVPATLVPRPGHRHTVHVQFLEADQISALDRTEIGYQRRWLSRADTPITLEDGTILDGAHVYVSEGGFLCPRGSEPVGLLPQADLFALIRRASPALTALLPPSDTEVAQRARSDAPWRAQVNAALAPAGLIRHRPCWTAPTTDCAQG